MFVFDRAQYEEIHGFNPECIFHYPLAVDVKSKQRVIEAAINDKSAERFRCDISFVGSLYSEKDPLARTPGITEYTKGFLDGLCESQLRVYGYFFAQEMLNDRVIGEFTSSVKDYYRMKADNHLTDRIVIGQYYMGNHIISMERQRLIALISERFPIDVYTRSDTDAIRRANCRGGCETLTEMPIIFNSSRININPTSKAFRTGVPLRVFDIFACVGFMLSNYQQELCELFVPGEDFVYYDSMEQVPDIIDHYLNNEKERKEIAHNAFQKVRNCYNYELRLNKLMLTAFER